MNIQFARSATKHRISRSDAAYVVSNAIEWFEIDLPVEAEAHADPRRLYLGPSPTGRVLEVIAVATDEDVVLVIHAMPIREKFRNWIEEV